MGVVLANPHMQEVEKLQEKLSKAKDEEERKVISREMEITETNRQLATSRRVRQKFNVVIILTQAVVCHEVGLGTVQPLDN